MEFHQQLIELFAEYHNGHLGFIKRPSIYRVYPVNKALRKLSKLAKEFKRSNVALKHTIPKIESQIRTYKGKK